MTEEEEERRLREADLREGGRAPVAGEEGEAGEAGEVARPGEGGAAAGGDVPAWATGAPLPRADEFFFSGWKASRDCFREWMREGECDGKGDWRRVALAEAAAEDEAAGEAGEGANAFAAWAFASASAAVGGETGLAA